MAEVAGGRTRDAAPCGLSPFERSYASLQAAKTALFAAGDSVGSRKKRLRRLFSN